MINNVDNKDNNNTTTYILIGLFSVLLFAGIVCFCVFAYFKWFKGKKLFKKNILIIEHIKMDINSLEIKNKTNYDWDDKIYINDFDVNSLEIIKRESRVGANIYYTGYDYDTINPLYLVIYRLIGYIEEVEGSSNKYLVVAKSVRNKDIISVLDVPWRSIENKIEDKIYPIPNNYPCIKIKDYDKFRFNSDTNLPLDTLIEFCSIVINVSCVIEKDDEYYPESYLAECLYVKDKHGLRQFSSLKLSSLKKYNI